MCSARVPRARKRTKQGGVKVKVPRLVHFHGRERLFPVGFPDHRKETRETRPKMHPLFKGDLADATTRRVEEHVLHQAGGLTACDCHK
jgi:hypothetical protein